MEKIKPIDLVLIIFALIYARGEISRRKVENQIKLIKNTVKIDNI